MQQFLLKFQEVQTTRLRLIASALMLVCSGYASAAGYTFTDLGTLEGKVSEAYGINNAGQVVGRSYITSATGVKDMRAILWNGVAATDLSGAARYSVALDINDAGQVVGYSSPQPTNNGQRATLWYGGAATDLGTLGGRESRADKINNSGQIVGVSDTALVNPKPSATLWSGSTITDLGGSNSWASGINDSGQIVGYSADDTYEPHATLWNGGTIMEIGTVGIATFANRINETGQIVGGSRAANSVRTSAILWNGSISVNLGLVGETSSFAYDINNTGQIVGFSRIGDKTIAVLWSGGTALDLNTYLDASTASAGWTLISARAINDHGWIAGNARNTITGKSHAFLLAAPVPEPEIYTMLLTGLGLLGAIARHRRQVPLLLRSPV